MLTCTAPAWVMRFVAVSSKVCCHDVGFAVPSIQMRAFRLTGLVPVTVNSTRTFCPTWYDVNGLVDTRVPSAAVVLSNRLIHRLTPDVPKRTRA
ncbi:hypothetical protein [Microbacterium lacticum]